MSFILNKNLILKAIRSKLILLQVQILRIKYYFTSLFSLLKSYQVLHGFFIIYWMFLDLKILQLL